MKKAIMGFLKGSYEVIRGLLSLVLWLIILMIYGRVLQRFFPGMSQEGSMMIAGILFLLQNEGENYLYERDNPFKKWQEKQNQSASAVRSTLESCDTIDQ